MDFSRRRFLEGAAIGSLAPAVSAAATDGKGTLPTRVLGRTGVNVSILAFGGGSRFMAYTEDQAVEAVNHAIDLGINYIDTAAQYGVGQGERRIGKVMKTRRKEVFLATKVDQRQGDKAMPVIEACLKRLQTDHLDLLHIHMLTTAQDLAAIEAKDGVLNTLLKMRDQKVTRFIGITCHHDPTILKTALERHDFDCTQMALNAALVGMKPLGGHMAINEKMKPSFQSIALPVANKKNLGVIAMKVLAADGLTGQATTEQLLTYSLSLPVATAVVGMSNLKMIEENTHIASNFKPMPADEMESLSAKLSARNKMALDLYFQHHSDYYPAV